MHKHVALYVFPLFLSPTEVVGLYILLLLQQVVSGLLGFQQQRQSAFLFISRLFTNTSMDKNAVTCSMKMKSTPNDPKMQRY